MSRPHYWLLFSLALTFGFSVEASVLRPLAQPNPSNPKIALPKSTSEFPQVVPMAATENALRAPHKKRLSLLLAQGPEGYKNLKQIAESESAIQELRWRAVMTMTQIGGRESLPELKSYLGHKAWFMRSAALRALQSVDSSEAISAARKLVQEDPSMLVRSAAVRVIRDLGDRESRSLLWEQLYSHQNFHRGRSLWIRRHILEALVEFSDATQTQRWVRVLKEDEEPLQEIALDSLQKWKPLPAKSQSLGFRKKRAAVLSQWQSPPAPGDGTSQN